MDDMTPEQRHRTMSNIRSADTKPEVILRKALWRDGFRYRKNVSALPGKPDIVLPKYHSVIFINGCFWHQHPECKYASIPKTRKDYWIPKLKRNTERDETNHAELESLGWRVIVVWECELKKKQTRQECVEHVEKTLREILSDKPKEKPPTEE